MIPKFDYSLHQAVAHTHQHPAWCSKGHGGSRTVEHDVGWAWRAKPNWDIRSHLPASAPGPVPHGARLTDLTLPRFIDDALLLILSPNRWRVPFGANLSPPNPLCRWAHPLDSEAPALIHGVN